MRRLVRPSLGLIGRIVAIVLITTLIEFGVSTFLYERASRFEVRSDEARRLAEHLVVSRRVLAESAPADRPVLAAELTTGRYQVSWDRVAPRAPPIAPSLDRMRQQVVAWEPSLPVGDLLIGATGGGRRTVAVGGLRLPDGSWLHFRTREPVAGLSLASERVLLALVPAVALMALGGLLVRRTLRPLRRLAAAADRIGGGEEVYVDEGGAREVVGVVRAFNRMQQRIGRLIADRTQSLAAVAHDLRTPLARLRLRAEGIAEPDVRAAVEREVTEMDAMIASMLAYLGGDTAPEAPGRCDVAVLCATLVDGATDGGGDARYQGPDHHEATVRAGGLKRALDNLLGNALRYGSAATLSLLPRADALVFRVEDDGPGIPEADLARVLEPFVRLDAARARDTGGFGLGLAIARRLAEADGGTLALANRPGGGLAAEIVLPVAPATIRYTGAASQQGGAATS